MSSHGVDDRPEGSWLGGAERHRDTLITIKIPPGVSRLTVTLTPEHDPLPSNSPAPESDEP
jgi:hypothetical protein